MCIYICHYIVLQDICSWVWIKTSDPLPDLCHGQQLVGMHMATRGMVVNPQGFYYEKWCFNGIRMEIFPEIVGYPLEN